jgi:hypothetical protein
MGALPKEEKQVRLKESFQAYEKDSRYLFCTAQSRATLATPLLIQWNRGEKRGLEIPCVHATRSPGGPRWTRARWVRLR